MHVAFLMSGLPSTGNHGGALTCWAIIAKLRKEKHRVSVVSLYDTSQKNPYHNHRDDNVHALAKIGAELIVIDYDFKDISFPQPYEVMKQQGFLRRILTRYRRISNPDLAYFYHPFPGLKAEVADRLRTIRPDVCFAYHFEPLAAIDGLTLPPVMAGFGDLTHLPQYFRFWKEEPPKYGWKYLKGVLWNSELRWIHTRLMHRVLSRCQWRGAFADHYSRWLTRHTSLECEYLRTPIADPVGTAWSSCRKENSSGKPRILMIGDLFGTVSRSGLKLTALEVLPELEKQLGREGFEIHVVGRGRLPEEIAKAFKSPSIVMRGVVDPAHDEFLSAHILFVPTPIPLGIRVRIILGLSFGCCIVTHVASQQGIPELIDGRNCLLSTTGRGLAQQLTRALHDNELRVKLQANARQTYVDYFSEDVAAGHITSKLESLVVDVDKVDSFDPTL